MIPTLNLLQHHMASAWLHSVQVAPDSTLQVRNEGFPGGPGVKNPPCNARDTS